MLLIPKCKALFATYVFLMLAPTQLPAQNSEEPFWPEPFKCSTPAPKVGHKPGSDCQKCHEDFVFSGTVFKKGTVSGEPNVEVGLKHKDGFVSVCSGSNGNFFVRKKSAEGASEPEPSLDWSTARLHIRTASFEKKKPRYIATRAECNVCHQNMSKIQIP